MNECNFTRHLMGVLILNYSEFPNSSLFGTIFVAADYYPFALV